MPTNVVVLSHQGGTAFQEQMENIVTKATSIAILASLYFALFATGIAAYAVLYFHKDELDTLRLFIGCVLASGVVNYAIFKGYNEVMDLAEEK